MSDNLTDKLMSEMSDNLADRLNSYMFWKGDHDTDKLALAGFRYTGVGDEVACPECELYLYNWMACEDPIKAHTSNTPHCPFVIRNMPHEISLAAPIRVQSITYPQFSNYICRFESFAAWPLKDDVHKADNMAKSGFFYTGSADRVMCYYCGIEVQEWKGNDYPTDMHLRISGKCPHILRIVELDNEETSPTGANSCSSRPIPDLVNSPYVGRQPSTPDEIFGHTILTNTGVDQTRFRAGVILQDAAREATCMSGVMGTVRALGEYVAMRFT